MEGFEMNDRDSIARQAALTSIERNARQILRDIHALRTLRTPDERAEVEAREREQFRADCDFSGLLS